MQTDQWTDKQTDKQMITSDCQWSSPVNPGKKLRNPIDNNVEMTFPWMFNTTLNYTCHIFFLDS